MEYTPITDTGHLILDNKRLIPTADAIYNLVRIFHPSAHHCTGNFLFVVIKKF